MRIYQNKPFQRFSRREGVTDENLCEAVERAERGLVDADLGGGVIKQRIPRPGGGRSGGFRTIILYRAEDLAIFVYGFPKNDRANIAEEELQGFRQLANLMLNFSDDQFRAATASGALAEVICDEQDV